ncbi:unnamed protein product [Pleuronectes platessa]|uniref:Uncharacterized protein n=1 Tax=Pleuronectes platessa TaxID=8262 RepID=A0A9N7YTQ8_PLEPL|nr:unnamed protein product [Pleuronectes platessa]
MLQLPEATHRRTSGPIWLRQQPAVPCHGTAAAGWIRSFPYYTQRIHSPCFLTPEASVLSEKLGSDASSAPSVGIHGAVVPPITWIAETIENAIAQRNSVTAGLIKKMNVCYATVGTPGSHCLHRAPADGTQVGRLANQNNHDRNQKEDTEDMGEGVTQ